MSNVKVTGQKQLIAELENRFGKQKMQRVSDDALKRGAKMFVKEINDSIKSSGDKGYARGKTIEDTSISEPTWVGNARTIKIHWNGQNGRYRIIHLNEFGTIKNPNPPRKGAIARALRSAESEYHKVIKQAVKEGI